MRCPNVCKSCGMPIGDVAQVFYLKKKEILDKDSQAELGDLLDKLKIFNSCCRIELMTSVNFHDTLMHR